jgi:hypothetical protein
MMGGDHHVTFLEYTLNGWVDGEDVNFFPVRISARLVCFFSESKASNATDVA